MIKIQKAFATSTFDSKDPTMSLQDIEKEIGRMFQQINDLFKLTLNKFYRPVIEGSTKLLKEGKHVLLVLGKDLSHTFRVFQNNFLIKLLVQWTWVEFGEESH